MKRTTELKRTPFKRAAPAPSTKLPPAKKPAAEPKRRTRKCAVPDCRQPFEPRSMTHKACSPDCAEALVALEKKRENRRALVEFRKKHKSKAKHIAELQVVFNAWVRERDADQPCIDCGRFAAKTGVPGGEWDAGHYLSRGHAPHLRFDERNVHRQLKGCNRPGGATRAAFRQGMEARIGREALLALESDVTQRHYTIADVIAMKAHYAEKLRALKAKHADAQTQHKLTTT